MKKIIIPILVVLIIILSALVIATIFGEPPAPPQDEMKLAISKQQTEVAEIVAKTLAAIPTATPTAPPTPTAVVAMSDVFHADYTLTVYQIPDFTGIVIGKIPAGSDVNWLDNRKDYSSDPNWYWYHIAFPDPAYSTSELHEGYVAVATEAGKAAMADSCGTVAFDALFAMSKKTSREINYPGFVFSTGMAGEGQSVIAQAVTLGDVKTENFNGNEIDSVGAVMVIMDTSTGKPVIYPFRISLGVQTSYGYLNNAMKNFKPPETCEMYGWCGLDYYRNVKEEWNRENIIKRYKDNMYFVTLDYGDATGYTFDVAKRWFDYSKTPQAWVNFPGDNGRGEKLFKIFGEYEASKMDIMNTNFMLLKPVPKDWVNLAFVYNRLLSVNDSLKEMGYDEEKVNKVGQCLQSAN